MDRVEYIERIHEVPVIREVPKIEYRNVDKVIEKVVD